MIDPLLEARAAGAESAAQSEVAALYREHRTMLLRLAAAITLNSWLAEEVVHDAFVGLQRQRSEVDNPAAYLQRSVVNLSVNVLRRRSVAARHPTPPPSTVSSPEIDDTWSAVARLPPPQRAVIALRFWQDMTVDDIAATLGWPAGTVKSTLHRALKRLGEELA